MKIIDDFKENLICEKTLITEKYIYDVNVFTGCADGAEITKDIVLAYNEEFISKYAVRSANFNRRDK